MLTFHAALRPAQLFCPIVRQIPTDFAVLTTDYINHLGALAMLLEIVPNFPETMTDLLAWQPLSYEAHVRAITFTDPAPLLAYYEALDPAIKTPFDAAADNANHYGVRLIGLLTRLEMTEADRRDLCLLGHATLSAFIQRINSLIAGANGETMAPLPDDLQNHVDQLLAVG